LIDRYFSDESWARIGDILPGKKGDAGCTGRDNRLFMEAVLWIARVDAPWRDLPPEFGKWYTAYTRFRRWSKKGVWPRVFAAIGENPSCDYVFVDGEIRWRPRRAVIADDDASEAEQPSARAAA